MQSHNHKTGVARLWELAFTYKILIIFACLFSILSVVAAFLPFIAVYFIVQELIVSLSAKSPLNSELMIYYGWFAFIAAASAMLLNFLALACSHIAAFKTLYRLKYHFVRYMAYLPLGFHVNHSSGALRKIVDDDIEKMEKFIAHQLPDIVGSFAAPITILVILAIFDWRLGLATLVPIGFAYVALISGFRREDAKLNRQEYQKRLEDMSSASVEYIRGITVVKAFNQTFFSFKRFYEAIRAYQLFCIKFTHCFENHMALFLLLLNNIYLFLVPVIILFSDHVDNYTDFTLAAIFYLIFSVALPAPFMKLMYVTNGMQEIVGSVEKMDLILNTSPLPEPQTNQATDYYDICFDDVSFAYQNNQTEVETKTKAENITSDDENAINHISFTAKQGKITALVGLSGSGKSTISLLIPRFFDPQKGCIKIGGVDIKQMSNDYLLSLISFVFQDVFMFKQSILDNIKIGKPTATLSEVITAAKAAQCHDFIEKLPNGYQSIIGTQGLHLSGGEMQRLAIARALLKNAPILVLDEATSFADPENEYKIQLALKALMKDKTVIMIAHRLSTIKDADQIVVLDKGSVVEKGSHQNLMENQSYYSRMWQYYTQTLNWHINQAQPNNVIISNDFANKHEVPYA